MKVIPLILSSLLVASALHAEETKTNAQLLAEARQAFGQKKYEQAIDIYGKLRQQTEGTPDAEAVQAEFIGILVHQHKDPQAVEESISFLQKYQRSVNGFKVSFALSMTLVRMGRYEDGFKIFSSFRLEDLRALDADSRGQIFSVLDSALAGMKKEPARQALRAEANGMFVDRQGKALLNGPLSMIPERFATQEALNEFVRSLGVGAEEKRDLRKVTDPDGKNPAIERQRSSLSFAIALGLSSHSITAPTGPQSQLQQSFHAELFHRMTGAGTGFNFLLASDANVYSATPSTAGFRNVRLGIDSIWTVSGESVGSLFHSGVGLHFITSSTSPTDTGFRNVLMPLLHLGYRYGQPDGEEFLLTLSLSPVLAPASYFGLKNLFIEIAGEWAWPIFSRRHNLGIFVSFASLSLENPATLSRWTRILGGVAFRFGAQTHLLPVPPPTPTPAATPAQTTAPAKK